MDFEEKKARAMQIIAEKKMWKSNCVPPLLRLLWKMGFKIPPLPFAPAWLVFLIFGLWFGTFWGIWMWFITWKAQCMAVRCAFLHALEMGILTGSMMALFHVWRRKANRLPKWRDLDKYE